MRWWCSAQGVAWDWTWTPYIGVWLFVLAIGVGYALQLRRLEHPANPLQAKQRRRDIAFFSSGLVILWVALDWPLGPLGASYLVSVHMVQFLLIALIAPALMLLGTPRAAYEKIRHSGTLYGVLREMTQPLVAFFVFNVVMTVTHWPTVVDALMVTQIGSFALDMMWLASGLVFWWPIVAPVPERSKFHPMFKMAYLGLNAILIRPPFFILLFSKFPAYATYELAPPIAGTSVLGDQQLAGGIMKAGSAWIMLTGMGIVFYRWQRKDSEK